MSWNKNTVNFSNLDSIVSTLEDAEIPFKVTTLGRVDGRGLNDTYMGTNAYSIRKLQYKDTIVLEQMQRTHDCDSDDCIISVKIPANREPKKWDLEIYLDEE